MKKNNTELIAKITEKEKSSPAYRKKLELENLQLRNSLEKIQDQASALQSKSDTLEKQNILYAERLRNSGLLSVILYGTNLLAGAGISYFVEKKFEVSATLFFLMCLSFLVYLAFDRITQK